MKANAAYIAVSFFDCVIRSHQPPTPGLAVGNCPHGKIKGLNSLVSTHQGKARLPNAMMAEKTPRRLGLAPDCSTETVADLGFHKNPKTAPATPRTDAMASASKGKN